jgi:3-oxoacyl-[acyl-carrier protein] reductase
MDAGKLFRLDGRVALITGASSGLGERMAEVAAENGAKVVLVARRKDRLEALKAKIEKAGGKALVAVADVTDRKAMVAAFDAAEKAFGTVDLLVANAGIARVKKISDMTESSWREVLDTNLDAVFFWSREAANRMSAAKKPGAIVTISSIAGFTVAYGLSSYHVAKAAVVQVTKALALEFARKGIRVNTIAPGYVVTEINSDYLLGKDGQAMQGGIPLNRFGDPSDLDGAFLLLASDAGRLMTGSTIVVDAGLMLMVGG